MAPPRAIRNFPMVARAAHPKNSAAIAGGQVFSDQRHGLRSSGRREECNTSIGKHMNISPSPSSPASLDNVNAVGARAARDPSIDVLRGLAVFMMVAANLAASALEGPHPLWFRLYGSFAAPLFVLLSGMMVAYTARRKAYG